MKKLILVEIALLLLIEACRTISSGVTPVPNEPHYLEQVSSKQIVSPVVTQTPVITGDMVDSARNASIILAFFDAYNAANLNDVLAFIDEKGQISDCDFLTNKPVLYQGKKQITNWLRQRFADHDQFVVGEVNASNSGAGVVFARRTSDILRTLGYAKGIVPNFAAKIAMVWGSDTIAGIALGPGFHSTNSCYSAFGITPSPR